MGQTQDSSAGAARLRGLRRLLERLRYLLPLLCAALAALAVAILYGAGAFGLLPVGVATRLSWLAAGAALLAILLAALAWLTLGRPILLNLQLAERSQQKADAQLRRRARLGEMAALLQQAQSPAELAQSLLSGLARCISLQQALCCFWDEGSQSLAAAARYGGEGANAAEIMASQPRLGALLLEAARQRRTLSISSPGAGFMRIVSGLGDAAPAELLLHPVQDRGQLFAVLELAGLRTFGEEDRSLLAEISPVFAMCLDILQRADRTEVLLEQARATEEHSRLILDAVGEGIWGMDDAGRTTFANPAALRMLGYRLEEVVGQVMHTLVHHHHADGREFALADCAMHQTTRDGVARRVEREVLWHKDGRAVPVEYAVTPIRRGSIIAGVVVVCSELSQGSASPEPSPPTPAGVDA